MKTNGATGRGVGGEGRGGEEWEGGGTRGGIEKIPGIHGMKRNEMYRGRSGLGRREGSDARKGMKARWRR